MTQPTKPIRARIRRAVVDGGLTFITTVAHRRKPVFTVPEIARLRAVPFFSGFNRDL